MKALDILQKARESEHLYQDGTSICIYGAPKTGKTIFAATAAKAPHVERVIIYDFEHSYPSIFTARDSNGEPLFTHNDLKKIEIVQIPDTKERPIATETAPKIVTAKRSFTIDDTGKVSYNPKPGDDFILDPTERGPNIVEIFDSGSQIADSILNWAKNTFDYKDLRKYYGEVSSVLVPFLISIQNMKGIRIVVSHTSIREVKNSKNETIREELFPYMGSVNQSRNSGKYFDTIIYKEIQLKKFASLSTPTARATVMAGSRYNIDLSKFDNPTLADVLVWKEETIAKDASQATSNIKQLLKQNESKSK